MSMDGFELRKWSHQSRW